MNHIDFDYQFWWSVALSLATLATWLRRPGEQAGEAVTKLKELIERDLAELRDLVSSEVSDIKLLNARLEERVKHMPSQEEVGDLSGDVKAIKAQMIGFTTTQGAQSLSLGRIESWLIANGRGHK